MSNTATNFNREFLPIPAQDYLVRMTSCREVETKNKKGRMIKATFQVINGDHKNRLIFDNFIVEHESEKAAFIGNERLSNYLKAVGVEGGLEGIGHDRTLLADYLESPFVATVKIEKGSTYTQDGVEKMGKDNNRIASFKTR